MVRTDRRGFLGRLGAIAAAVVAVEAAPKVAEASAGASDLWFSDAAIEHGDGPTGWYHGGDGVKQYLIDGVRVTPDKYYGIEIDSVDGIYLDHNVITMTGYVTALTITNVGTQTNPLRVTDARGVERAVIYGNDPATLHLRAGEFTAAEVNEWMTLSGARNIQGSGTMLTTIHGPGVVQVPGSASFMHWTPAPLTPRGEQIRADGYADGYTQATQRARSRIAEGLTV